MGLREGALFGSCTYTHLFFEHLVSICSPAVCKPLGNIIFVIVHVYVHVHKYLAKNVVLEFMVHVIGILSFMQWVSTLIATWVLNLMEFFMDQRSRCFRVQWGAWFQNNVISAPNPRVIQQISAILSQGMVTFADYPSSRPKTSQQSLSALKPPQRDHKYEDNH